MPESFGGSLKRGASSRNESLSPPPVKRKYESTTTNKAVASFFTPISKKQPDTLTWRIVENSLLIGKYKPDVKSTENNAPSPKRRKIAAFDFDSTLIQTSSGNVFGKDASDWQWWHISVPGALKALYANRYIVAVISNQGGISLKSDSKTVKSDQKRLSEFKAKVTSVFSQLDFPISIYAGTSRDKFRKPRTGMWHELLEDNDLDVGEGIDLEDSIFVGDAAGRPARESIKQDHSSSDRDFAVNVGIQFKTPEEYFRNEPEQSFSRSFEPALYLSASTSVTEAFQRKHLVEIVICCGSPGAGKSTFYWEHLKPLGYERINQDILKTRNRCLKMASDCISVGKSVVIDNTNADLETRSVWIQLARKANKPIRCLYFTAPAKLCEHNDTVRALNGGVINPEKRSILPHSAFSSFSSRFREPQLKEGFEDIVVIPFQFQGENQIRAIWSKYWI